MLGNPWRETCGVFCMQTTLSVILVRQRMALFYRLAERACRLV